MARMENSVAVLRELKMDLTPFKPATYAKETRSVYLRDICNPTLTVT